MRSDKLVAFFTPIKHHNSGNNTMPQILYLDTETYNEQPIANGVYAYAETVEIMLFQYAFNDVLVCVVDLANGEKLPQ